MISVITYGRNDNYSFNLGKRVALGFNCLAEVLTEQDEILFVDYNTPEPLPTLPEFIWDTPSTILCSNFMRSWRLCSSQPQGLAGAHSN